MLFVVLAFTQPRMNSTVFHENQDCRAVQNPDAQHIINGLQQSADEQLKAYKTICEKADMLNWHYRDLEGLRRECTALLTTANHSRLHVMNVRAQSVTIFGCAE